jgi:Dienelactone hydrolase and related enzymes
MKRGYLIASLVAALSSTVASAQGDRPRQIGESAGSGPHPAVAEAWPDAPGYTVYRPLQLPDDPLPVVVWGNGACRDNGLSASHFLREIASHGYLVIANGSPREEVPPRDGPAVSPPRPPDDPPPAPPARTADETSVAQYLGAIDWAERANSRDGALAGRVNSSRVAAMGHSCGGLQALSAGADPRVDTVVAFASGVYNRPGSGLSGVQITKDDLKRLHTPVAYFLGGPEDIAFPNGSDDFARIDHVPVMLANLPVGHGGTLGVANGGDWARVGVAWLDWQLKGDAQAARWFVGPHCRLCTSFGWTVQRKQFPEFP